MIDLSSAILFVNFHHVKSEAPKQFPLLNHISTNNFLNQIDLLSKIFSFPDPEKTFSDTTINFSKSPQCFLTFDDGLRDHFDFVFPILEKKGIRGIFSVNTAPWKTGHLLSVHMNHLLSGINSYIELCENFLEAVKSFGIEETLESVRQDLATSQYRYDSPEVAKIKYYINVCVPFEYRASVVEKVFRMRIGDPRNFVEHHYMNKQMCKTLYEHGHILSLHTHNHIYLTSVSANERLLDLNENREALGSAMGLLHKPNRWISYPYGGPQSYDEDVITQVKDLGVMYGLTMKRGINSLGATDPLRLKRVDTNDVIGGRFPKSWDEIQR